MLTKNKVIELSNEALKFGNPYIEKSIKYFIGTIEHYIYAHVSMNKEEIDAEYLKTAQHDIQCGYNDRKVGYYDKWYRYNHADEGRAYDLGVKFATQENKCPEEFYIIECTN